MDNAQLYVQIYYNILLCCTIWLVCRYRINNPYVGRKFALWFGILLIIYFAFRPISSKYGLGDTKGYAFFFEMATREGNIFDDKDLGFSFIINNLLGLPVWTLFGTMATLYVLPLIISSRLLFAQKCGIAFFIVICSFSFFGYAVNGMRNGAATSLILLGLITPYKLLTVFFFAISLSLHKSVLLIIAAYFLTLVYNKPKAYIIAWLICLLLSFFIPSFLAEVLPISELLGSDDRFSNYLSGSFSDTDATFSHTGFRLDFLIYSVIPIYIGWKAIFKDRLVNKNYLTLYNIYLVCNSFWLFTINIPYNNRFAYLSWFLYPILISYPYLKGNEKNNYLNVKILLILNYSFTYIMWIL